MAQISTKSVYDKLTRLFAPDFLDVTDESHQHEGHAGWRAGEVTHMRVAMRSARFDGLSRIERSRLVHAALREELDAGLHALALDLAGESDGYAAASVGGPQPGPVT